MHSSALPTSGLLDAAEHFAIVVETNINAVGCDIIIVDKDKPWRNEVTTAAMILTHRDIR